MWFLCFTGHWSRWFLIRRLGFRGLGFRGLGFRGLGFRGLGFRGLGFRGLGFRGFAILVGLTDPAYLAEGTCEGFFEFRI